MTFFSKSEHLPSRVIIESPEGIITVDLKNREVTVNGDRQFFSHQSDDTVKVDVGPPGEPHPHAWMYDDEGRLLPCESLF
jgi:hypothetical protein